MWFLWWLRHGAIGPIEATLFRVNVDWPEFWIYTFELVIHLSKVQQMAVLFFSHFEISCCSGCPRDYWPMRFFNCEAVPNFRNLLFSQLLLTIHDNSTWYRNQAGTRLSGVVFFFWWLSGEVKHFVHLIRWNLEAVICRLGQELTTGLEWHNCTTFRFRNWILFVKPVAQPPL